MTRLVILLLLLSGCGLSRSDLQFMEDLTRSVVDSSKLLPGQELPPAIASFGPNNTGITLIKPGGRDCYPSFWIRDYAMSLECGMFTEKEQKDMLLFTASRQSDSSWTTATGSFVPQGSIADHIRVNDGLPVFFPGTYSFENQGAWLWQVPPYDDQFFFIHMAWFYLNQTGDTGLLHTNIQGKTLLRRLTEAFESVPVDAEKQLVVISSSSNTTDFGFRDIVTMTGYVSFGSVLRYRAAREMSNLFTRHGNELLAKQYDKIAARIAEYIVPVFADERGMLRASSGKSAQPDVWATAFAVYIGVLDRAAEKKACKTLVDAYYNGIMAYEGQIRHILTTDDYSASTAWEVAQAPLNHYQNGAYWATATGWVVFAMNRVSHKAALSLANDYIRYLRKNDFRMSYPNNGAPWECIHPDGNYQQNPVYLASVTGPLAIFRQL